MEIEKQKRWEVMKETDLPGTRAEKLKRRRPAECHMVLEVKAEGEDSKTGCPGVSRHIQRGRERHSWSEGNVSWLTLDPQVSSLPPSLRSHCLFHSSPLSSPPINCPALPFSECPVGGASEEREQEGEEVQEQASRLGAERRGSRDNICLLCPLQPIVTSLVLSAFLSKCALPWQGWSLIGRLNSILVLGGLENFH